MNNPKHGGILKFENLNLYIEKWSLESQKTKPLNAKKVSSLITPHLKVILVQRDECKQL